MPKAIKFFDPNTGTIVARDCLTGALISDTQLADATPCPTVDIETLETCIQPTGNTDPSLIEKGGKEVTTYEISYNADNTVAATSLVSTTLYDALGTDVTSTHEKTDCPAGLLPVGEICYS